MTVVRLAVWLAGAALCATLLVGSIQGDWLSPPRAAVDCGATFAAITIGLVVWRRRPDSRTGILLIAFPFVAALANLSTVFWGSVLAVTIGFAASFLGAPIFGQIALSYPTGRLSTRLDRGAVIVAYAVAVAYSLSRLLFYDPRRPHDPTVWECWNCAVPVTHVAWADVLAAERYFDWAFFALALVLVTLLARKLLRAGSRARRVVLPLALASSFVALQFAVQVALYGSQVNSWAGGTWFWIVELAGLAVPISLAAGLLWGRTARSAVADLVVDLEQTPPGRVREALARRLGDPSLQVALWLPDRASYVDEHGVPITLPAAGADRAVTVLGPADAPVAALIHDPALLERRGLLDAAGAAARLALENERLQAELRAQLAELRASRARIVTLGDEERRRLERDLHDGAQQRLLGLGLALQLARAQLAERPDATDGLLREADGELRAALDELRELARGIHPAVLTEQGLGPALRTLAERSPVAVTVDSVPFERLAAPAEAAAYFVVSEALANVTKYAQASSVHVGVVRENGRLLVDVDDDGVGGADPARGSGLRGLLDRVQALDGELRIESGAGSGTHVHAEIPCA